MGIELQWGLNPIPENAMAAWGARAILKQQCLDLLWDRQCFVQGELSEREKDRLVNWINKKGLPKLREHIVKNRWKNDSEEVFELNQKTTTCVPVADALTAIATFPHGKRNPSRTKPCPSSKNRNSFLTSARHGSVTAPNQTKSEQENANAQTNLEKSC